MPRLQVWQQFLQVDVITGVNYIEIADACCLPLILMIDEAIDEDGTSILEHMQFDDFVSFMYILYTCRTSSCLYSPAVLS